MYPVFPVFEKLTLDDKDRFNQLVIKYTPFSDFSFATLHIWWNLDDKLSFTTINNNLVLNYSQPFEEQGTGLSLIGESMIDDSIKILFDYLREQNQTLKLVHVPEFTRKKIHAAHHYKIEEEVDMHEYVMDAKKLSTLQSSDLGRIRRKVNRFLREIESKILKLSSINLESAESRRLIFESLDEWDKKYPKQNDPNKTESRAIQSSLSNYRELEIKNLCLFVDGTLQAVVLYHLSHDSKYCIINHLRVDYAIPFIFDYMTQQIAIETSKNNVPYLNMEMDLGVEGLRNHKMGLRPINFLKKYTISLESKRS
jgi:hypothetical protein